MMRMSDHKIAEPLLYIRLYKNKLAGENISKNTLTEISRYGLYPVFWRVRMMDIESINKKALRVIK